MRTRRTGHGEPAVLSARVQGAGPGAGVMGLVWRGAAAGASLTHALPVHVEDKALGTEHCVVDTVEGSQGVHTELSPATIVSTQQALVSV